MHLLFKTENVIDPLKILMPTELYLIFATLLLILFTAFTGFETNNKYKVLNSMGQQVFFAAEGEVSNQTQVLMLKCILYAK